MAQGFIRLLALTIRRCTWRAGSETGVDDGRTSSCSYLVCINVKRIFLRMDK